MGVKPGFQFVDPALELLNLGYQLHHQLG